DIHAGRMGSVLGSRHQAAADEGVERFRDLLKVVPDEGRQVLTGEERSRMPGKEEQKIEVAGSFQHPDTIEKPVDGWLHPPSRWVDRQDTLKLPYSLRLSVSTIGP